MSFQRSQSKVWFGSQPNSVYDNFYSLPTYYNTTKNALQSISEQHEESLSPKSEVEDLKRSLLIWGNRKSPSSHSHKSQVRNFGAKKPQKSFFLILKIIINRIQGSRTSKHHRHWAQTRRIYQPHQMMMMLIRDRLQRVVKLQHHQQLSEGRRRSRFMKKLHPSSDYRSAHHHRP